jgi:EAL domain-containing protein (putative c-di-GMP-specific phosphodiesterase class I)
LFFKSAAKRNPTPATAAAAPAAAVPEAPHTVETLCQQLREVLPTRRLQSISLCDHEANVVWLSEGALGPDEHTLVTEALAALSEDTSLPCHEMGLEDGRLALCLPVRSPNGNVVGVAMILADRKSVGDDTLERMTAAPVRTIMQRLAVLLRPGDRPSSGTARVPVLELDDDPAITAALMAVEERIPTAAAAPGSAAVDTPISAAEIDDILEFDLDPQASAPRQEPPAVVPMSAMATPKKPEREAAVLNPGVADMVELDFEAPAAKGPMARAPKPAPAPERPAVIPPAPRPSPPPRPAAARPATPPAPVVTPAAAVAPVAPAAAPPTPRSAPAPAAVAPAIVTPAPFVAVGASAASAALVNDPNLLLELLPFAKLRAGGQTRRFQVIARGAGQQRDPAAVDALVLQRLLGWLAAHRAAWNSQPTSFTVSLSIASIEDERFAQKMAATLNTHGISAESIGYEITEAVCTQRRAQVERFITQCDKIGSWVVIDDFSFDSQVLPLLKSKALRLVKIDSKLSSNALKDKLCQALVVATVQASKVLGIHCAAKKVDSQAALQWLTAIGCDFAQGQALAQAQPLDALASSPDPTGISAMAMPS